uniref:Macaca fascicularis brain cDNA clone: QflA-10404, similar to human protein tyrosine phosphatase, receptor type, Npolypeptide 2 (PTPRN2), transcript variant 1, mRNA, RefSeq: NM_002847.2 n=1 Tax=Macaca fascicularis TaxID=9541 RepID=I7GHS3_MACFA|nr:unnamed protein product [Macaca fascicularis]
MNPARPLLAPPGTSRTCGAPERALTFPSRERRRSGRPREGCEDFAPRRGDQGHLHTLLRAWKGTTCSDIM